MRATGEAGYVCVSGMLPSAGTGCTCLPSFGVQLCRIWGDMPSFFNCCHVLRVREANMSRFAIYELTIYNEAHNAKVRSKLRR